MKFGSQTTLRDRVALDGIGVHSGKPVSIVMHPADAGTGVVFLRTGLEDGGDREIRARHDEVIDTRLCTVIGGDRASVATIEHLMAALSGLGVDNVIVEIDGAEVPVMDGSSEAFVEAIDQVGLVTLRAARRYIRVLKPVRVELGRGFAELLPYDKGFKLDVEIDFSNPLIGRQRKVIDLTPDAFRKDVSRARTFGMVRDVKQLWGMGLALGSSLDNSVAVDEDRILNPGGLRYPNEFVRHKMLDAVGDLSLAGAPILGEFRSYCGGHTLNHMVLEALFADETAYAEVEEARRPSGRHAELPAVAAPAYAPETN